MTTVQLATIPEREPILKQVIDSLINQVDRINIMLNNYDHIPKLYTENPIDASTHFEKVYIDGKINYFPRHNEMTDAEKYYGVENLEGYIFTCDDDLVYPPDYVSYMISKIEQYERKALISFHGSVFSRRRPFTTYIYNRLEVFRCLQDQDFDTYVDICGNGCMAFHSDTIKVSYSDFKYPDCSDLQFSIMAYRKNIPRIVVAHKALISLDPEQFGPTIWDRQNKNEKNQINLLNKYWI
jgi:hypothetical protein